MNSKPANKWAQFSGMALQMGGSIVLFTFLGIKLDDWLATNFPIYTLIGALLGVFLAMYFVIKSVMKISKDEE